MKIKDYLETLPENINISGMKGLFGKELKILEPYFESIVMCSILTFILWSYITMYQI